MKRLLFLLVFATVAVSVQAQEEAELRDLKLAVRNARGKVVRNIPFVAFINGSSSVQSLNDSGNSFFKVSDADTLSVMAGNTVYEFSVTGYDSLYVVFKNRNKIAGIADYYGEVINTGYGTISLRNSTSATSVLNMERDTIYRDLRSYIEGRVAGVQFLSDGRLIIRGINSINTGHIEALVVVDGVPVSSFAEANAGILVSDVKSISVLKDAASSAIYGVRDANGVVVITTQKGGE